MSASARLRGRPVVVAAYAAGFMWFALRPDLAASDSLEMSNRALIAFLLPTAAAVLLWVFGAIASRQPAWARDPAECAATDRILLRCVIFIGALHGLVVLRLSEISWMPTVAPRLVFVLLGAALVSVGNLLPTTRPNFLVGIRTSRSLGSRRFWMEINRAAGYAAVGLGLVVIVAAVALRFHVAGQVIVTAVLLAVCVVTARYRSLVRSTDGGDTVPRVGSV